MNSSPQLDNYTIGEEIGCGGFGLVYLATDKKDQSVWVIKKINLKLIKDKGIKSKMLEEAYKLNFFSHENIIRSRESFMSSDDRLYIVMEYADGGDLEEKIQEQRELGVPFPESQIQN